MDADRLDKLTAEQAYLFRHAVVRDAAYALQIPTDRARMHRLALATIEAVVPGAQRGPLAAELAVHARLAQADGDLSTREAERAYTWQAATLARANYNPECVRWLDAAAALEPAAEGRIRALQLAADVLMLSAHPADARPRLEQALALAREMQSANLESGALFSLATIGLLEGKHEKAADELTVALNLARTCDNALTEAMALINLASISRIAGRRDEGFEMQKQALAIYQRIGNARGISICLGNAAVYHSECGNHELALEACDRAIAFAIQNRNRRTEGIVYGTRAQVMKRLNRLPEAEAGYRRAIAIHIEIYNRAYEAFDRCRLAITLLARGDAPRARQEWLAGYEQMQSYGHATDIPVTLNDMREACATAGLRPFDERQ